MPKRPVLNMHNGETNGKVKVGWGRGDVWLSRTDKICST